MPTPSKYAIQQHKKACLPATAAEGRREPGRPGVTDDRRLLLRVAAAASCSARRLSSSSAAATVRMKSLHAR